MIKNLLLSFLLLGCGREVHTNNRTTDPAVPGETGSQGPPGDKGDPGVDGKNGTNGSNGTNGTNGVDGTTTIITVIATPPPVLTDPIQTTIDSLVSDFNKNRLFAGQAEVSNGLSCTVYKFGTVAVPQFPVSIAQATGGAGWTTRSILSFSYNGTLNVADSATSTGMSVMPTSVRPNVDFQQQYLLRCTGYVVVTETNYFNWDVLSDDGSILYLDNLIVNNDGNHGLATVSGVDALTKGLHSFRIDYMQAGGNQALIIKANTSLVDPKYFYH